jgi:hypothetical protein
MPSSASFSIESSESRALTASPMEIRPDHLVPVHHRHVAEASVGHLLHHLGLASEPVQVTIFSVIT